jgi:hypothetical protein
MKLKLMLLYLKYRKYVVPALVVLAIVLVYVFLIR